MPRHKFAPGNQWASKDHKALIAQNRSPEEREASKALLKNKVKSLTVAQVLEENAQAIVEKTIELALSGDTMCLKLCLERILPAKKFVNVESKLTAMGLLGLFPVAQEVGDSGD